MKFKPVSADSSRAGNNDADNNDADNNDADNNDADNNNADNNDASNNIDGWDKSNAHSYNMTLAVMAKATPST